MLLNLLFASIFLTINVVALLNFAKLFQLGSSASRRISYRRQSKRFMVQSMVGAYAT